MSHLTSQYHMKLSNKLLMRFICIIKIKLIKNKNYAVKYQWSSTYFELEIKVQFRWPNSNPSAATATDNFTVDRKFYASVYNSVLVPPSAEIYDRALDKPVSLQRALLPDSLNLHLCRHNANALRIRWPYVPLLDNEPHK